MFGSAALPDALAAPWEQLVDRLLRPSPLFASDDGSVWRLAAWDAGTLPLDRAEFAVLAWKRLGLRRAVTG